MDADQLKVTEFLNEVRALLVESKTMETAADSSSKLKKANRHLPIITWSP